MILSTFYSREFSPDGPVDRADACADTARELGYYLWSARLSQRLTLGDVAQGGREGAYHLNGLEYWPTLTTLGRGPSTSNFWRRGRRGLFSGKEKKLLSRQHGITPGNGSWEPLA